MLNRRIFLITISLIVILLLVATVFATQTNLVEKQEDTSIVTPAAELEIDSMNLRMIDSHNEYLVESELQFCKEQLDKVNCAYQDLIDIGYDTDSVIINLLSKEIKYAEDYVIHYTEVLNEIYKEKEAQRWLEKSEEYPVATEIWLYLKDLGYNDYVCAGIMGNMMTETSGQTLNIKVEVYDSAYNYYYGICQWNKGYSPEVWGANLKGQLKYLEDTIERAFDVFGFIYAKDFNYNAFLELTDERDAALAFAQAYERCASFSYGLRQQSATIAYDYFVNN